MVSRVRIGRHWPATLMFLVATLAACTGSPPSTSPTTAATGSGSLAPPSSSAAATTPDVDVRAASRTALALYQRYPNNLADPSAGYVWSEAPNPPVTNEVRDRLRALTGQGYFSDLGCAENYLLGNQVGLSSAPEPVSATANPDGSVTVVVRGRLGAHYRDLTVVVSQQRGTWVVSDLRRGTGAGASIFAARPNC